MTESRIPIPPALVSKHDGWRWTVAWEHQSGVVYRLEAADGETRYLKLTTRPRGFRTQPEADRMRWALPFISVPEVLSVGEEGGVDWLLTIALPGRDGVSPELLADPPAIVAALGRGLRRFHDALPVDACPFDSRVDALLAQARRRFADGLILPADFQDEFEGMDPKEALHRVEAERPEAEDLVVCHGDYCFPNALLQDGEVTGYLDLGELGVADRWYDLAVASWSTIWNVGPGYEEAFLAAYGIEPDRQRIAYYRLLHCMVS